MKFDKKIKPGSNVKKLDVYDKKSEVLYNLTICQDTLHGLKIDKKVKKSYNLIKK